MNTAKHAQAVLRRYAKPEKVKVFQNFFKTGPGQYGEGDVFIGVNSADHHRVALAFRELPFPEIDKLVRSRVHEDRLLGIRILVERYAVAPAPVKERIFRYYVRNAKRVNNWDLVDSSAHWIVGAHLENKDRSLLTRFARSRNLWERRIAIVSTWHGIRRGRHAETLRISKMLLNDEHDLIHKAVGWMLREVGKRDRRTLERFLKSHRARMPRTALRYAIERFSPAERRAYLKG
jgi:3-methyladenine DNA glycosylase AlkD